MCHREIVKRIDMWGIDMLFVVGGNGGNAGANAIQAMCQQHEVNCCVVGVPKSIDNDIMIIGEPRHWGALCCMVLLPGVVCDYNGHECFAWRLQVLCRA